MKLIDQTNKVFGKLTVISYDGNEHWKCRCSCGNFISAYIQRLRQGRITSCGSIRCKLKTDIVGQRFGRLVVFDDFKYMKKSGRWNRSYVKVKCDCGIEKYVMTVGLLGGDITSCGCYKREQQEEKVFKPYRISKGLDPNERIISTFRIARVKKELLKRDDYKCVLCGSINKQDNKLQLHHIVPVSHNALLENVWSNIVTVCKSCHFNSCHDGSWHKIDLIVAKQLQNIASIREANLETEPIKLYTSDSETIND